MSSHPVAVLRFLGRAMAVLGIAAGLGFAALGSGPGAVNVWIGVTVLGIAAVVLGHLLTAFDRPRGAAAAEDELVRWSETRSNAFGYWITLFVFLALLWAVRGERIPAEVAFVALGLPLGFAPVLYMIVAFLRGRAG